MVTAATSWTDFCLQQADRIVGLSRGGPVDVAVRQRAELRGCDLVACGVHPGSGALRELCEAADDKGSLAFGMAGQLPMLMLRSS